MDKVSIVDKLKSDKDLLGEVLSLLKDEISVEVSKDKNNKWDCEVCDVQDVFVGDNNTVILVVEAFL